MTNLTKLTKSEPKFVKMVNLVMQKFMSDSIRRNEQRKKCMSQLAQLAQFEGKCAKSVKSAMQKIDKTKPIYN